MSHSKFDFNPNATFSPNPTHPVDRRQGLCHVACVLRPASVGLLHCFDKLTLALRVATYTSQNRLAVSHPKKPNSLAMSHQSLTSMSLAMSQSLTSMSMCLAHVYTIMSPVHCLHDQNPHLHFSQHANFNFNPHPTVHLSSS